MKSHFFAYIARMRYITRWALMRNTFSENVQEHSHMVAVLAHALAVIRNRVYGGQIDAGQVAAVALYHDASEIITGDMPTPIKYYAPEIRDAYKKVGLDIEAGNFSHSKEVHHTHEGSIGNLCNDEVSALMRKVVDGFNFETMQAAEKELLGR